MQPLPAPRLAARHGAAQSAASNPSQALLKSRGGMAPDGGWVAHYQDWQPDARRYARQVSAASFSSGVIADLCAGCEFFVEVQNPDREWVPSESLAFSGLLESEYTNALQTANDLIRVHSWHYQVDGEMLFCWYDGPAGLVEYGIFSVACADWDKPQEGLVTLKDVPDGKVDKGTARIVPREQVIRFWLPDETYPGYAVSPMTAGVEDLRRYQALARRATLHAESNLAMEGIFWAPRGENEVPAPLPDLIDDAGDPGEPLDELEEAYYRLAGMRLQDSRDVTAIAPPFLRGEKDAAPAWVKIGEALDPAGIDYRREALEDFFRGTPLPVSSGVGGGVGDTNHWSEWLATEKFIDAGVRPTLDRVTHVDLTRAFLWPRARLLGLSPTALRGLRVGYSVDPIVVKQDRSDVALKSLALGAIGYEAARDACGFDESDAPTDDDLERILAITSKGTQGEIVPGQVPNPVTFDQYGNPSLKAGPGNVRALPPVRPTAPPAQPGLPQAAAVGLIADVTADGDLVASGPIPVPASKKLLTRLQRLRSAFGTRLLAQAKQAYEGAMASGRQKVVTRSKRQGSTRQGQVRAAVDGGSPLGPVLAAIGLTELEMLDRAFDTFTDVAEHEVAAYQTRSRELIEQAGLDADAVLGRRGSPRDVAEYLRAGLLSMVRQRLLRGDAAVLAAAADEEAARRRRLLPGAEVTGGEVLAERGAEYAPVAAEIVTPSGVPVVHNPSLRPPTPATPTYGPADFPSGLPDPKDLAQAAAKFVRNATAISDGRATFQMPSTLDRPPQVLTVEDRRTPEELVAATLTVETVWTWAHGFYGEPTHPLPDHEVLDGYETLDRDHDPNLYNGEAFPESDMWFPGDHDGCTCEWVLT